jgi:hypothetical protein
MKGLLLKIVPFFKLESSPPCIQADAFQTKSIFVNVVIFKDFQKSIVNDLLNPIQGILIFRLKQIFKWSHLKVYISTIGYQGFWFNDQII